MSMTFPSIPPSFFDIFGAIGFTFILAIAVLGLLGKRLPRWAFGILLIIGILGFIIDSAIVYWYYLRFLIPGA